MSGGWWPPSQFPLDPVTTPMCPLSEQTSYNPWSFDKYSLKAIHLAHCFSSVMPTPEAAALPANLLEMQIPGSHPGPAESEF